MPTILSPLSRSHHLIPEVRRAPVLILILDCLSFFASVLISSAAALVLHSSIVASKPLSSGLCSLACNSLRVGVWPPPTSPTITTTTPCRRSTTTAGVDSAGGGVRAGSRQAGRPAAEDRVERAAAAARHY